MADEAQEKKHDPSARRLQQLRRQGTMLRSRELSAALTICAVGVLFITAGKVAVMVIRENLYIVVDIIRRVGVEDMVFQSLVSSLPLRNILLTAVISALPTLVVILSPFLFGGWNLSLEAIAVKFERLNPVANIGKIFSPGRQLREILRSLFRLCLVLGAGVMIIHLNLEKIAVLLFQKPDTAGAVMVHILEQFILAGVLLAGVFAAVDMFIVRREFMQQHRMTAKELEDENRESEGSPETKRRVRNLRFAMMRQMIAVSVPKAAVVVTNPEHYAVALRYRAGKDSAPVLVAKGRGLLAAEIRRVALRSHVPIYAAPPVARAIYHTTRNGAQIYPELYMPVAIILSWLRQLSEWQAGRADRPEPVTTFEIPEKFRFKE